MSGYDPYDDGPRRSHIFRHAGFRVGALGGLMMGGAHILLLLMIHTDAPASIVQPFAYFMLARTAAESHHRAQRNEVNHLSGVVGAGVGAAMVTAWLTTALVILFLAVFDLIDSDIVHTWVMVNPVGLFLYILFDTLIAIALGSWGGKTIERKHQGFTGWGH